MFYGWYTKLKAAPESLSPFIREENRNMKTKNSTKMKYDREADILTLEADKGTKIDYARELGDVIVHFTKDNLPVLVEILNASSLLQQQELLGKIKTT